MLQMDREGTIITANKAVLNALEYKKNEELMNEFNSIPNENNKNEDGDLGGASANDKRPTNDEMKKLLEEAMNEIKTTQ